MRDWNTRITFNPNQCGGRPCVRGMRIRVVDVLDLFAAGLSFPNMVTRLGSPPKVIWLRCGNTSESKLKQIPTAHPPAALPLLAKGDRIVEIQ